MSIWTDEADICGWSCLDDKEQPCVACYARYRDCLTWVAKQGYLGHVVDEILDGYLTDADYEDLIRIVTRVHGRTVMRAVLREAEALLHGPS